MTEDRRNSLLLILKTLRPCLPICIFYSIDSMSRSLRPSATFDVSTISNLDLNANTDPPFNVSERLTYAETETDTEENVHQDRTGK